jgi:hypothetical protein
MKLEKIYDEVKKYLLLTEDDEDIEHKEISELNEKLEDKISKLKEKIKSSNNIEEENSLKQEIEILKKFRKQLKEKKI